MSKTPILAGLGIAATAGGGVGAAALSGAFGGSSGDNSSSITPILDSTNEEVAVIPQETPKKFVTPGIKLSSAKNIQKQYSSLTCAQKTFKEIDWNSESSAEKLDVQVKYKARDGKEKEIDSNVMIGSRDENITGCLNVWWSKENYGDKWKGNWNLLWTIKDGARGVVLLSTITTDNGKVEIDGVAYVLEKEENQDKWKILGKEDKEKTELTNQNEGELFIKPGKIIENKKDNWGFNWKDKVVCSNENSCDGSPINTEVENLNWDFKARETLAGNSLEQLENWSSNFSSWSGENGLFPSNDESIYQSVTGYFKLVS